MQHERNLARFRIVPVFSSRIAIAAYVRGESFDCLPKEMSQQVCPHLSRAAEGLGCAGRRDPDGENRLYGLRIDSDFNGLAASALRQNRLTFPQLLQSHKIAVEEFFSAFITVREKAKSSACHPDARAIPTRPLERLSTTDHSSAMRIGLWSGRTTLPARISMRRVTAAIAALVTDGLGKIPPNS